MGQLIVFGVESKFGVSQIVSTVHEYLKILTELFVSKISFGYSENNKTAALVGFNFQVLSFLASQTL